MPIGPSMDEYNIFLLYSMRLIYTFLSLYFKMVAFDILFMFVSNIRDKYCLFWLLKQHQDKRKVEEQLKSVSSKSNSGHIKQG